MTNTNPHVEPAPVAVPQAKLERERLRVVVRRYVTEQALVPPLSLEELQTHAAMLLQGEQLDTSAQDFIMVLLGSEVWRETVAGVPYDRRVLLLPQCLRSSTACPAERDEFGLLCEECGRCAIGELQALAESLGYVVLVAEGTTVVTKLLDRGRVDAVLGISCLSALERSFPHTAAHAIPGLAIPLFTDGCVDTQVDLDWAREAILLTSDSQTGLPIALDALREEVDSWFTDAALQSFFQNGASASEMISLSWMRKGGKRWRPFLVAAVYRAVMGDKTPFPNTLKKLAIAVECFHKASLVHDDIEDNDDYRYNDMTLHRAHGVPVAINIGDFLLGQGYALCAGCGLSAEQTTRIIAAAADAHRKLCLGQGEELIAAKNGVALNSKAVLDIFRLKTAPAFDVALQFGAIAAGGNPELCHILATFSEALGVAYQIRDDLHDVEQDHDMPAQWTNRPSLMTALNAERDHATEKAELLFEHYKNEAIRALNPLQNARLKTLLRRVLGKILGGA